MKLYLKIENGRRYFIPAPMWLVKASLGMGGLGVRIAQKHAVENQLAYLDNIDFSQMKKAMDVLKSYKGLTLVDIRTKDGTEVKIIV